MAIRTLIRSSVLAGVAVALMSAVPAVASAEGVRTSSSIEGTRILSEPGHVRIVYPDGKSAGWVSQEYLARNSGAVPGVDSAYACDREVCIDVKGSGLQVNTWGTQAFGNEGCIYATFRRIQPNGLIRYRNGDTICPDSGNPGVYYDYTGETGRFAHGTELGNGWRYMSGFPTVPISA